MSSDYRRAGIDGPERAEALRVQQGNQRQQVTELLHRWREGDEAGRDASFASAMSQDAVLRQLEVIGEAVKQLSTSTRERSPDVPWRDIAGMRDVLIHQYFAVDLEQVWEATQRDLGPLRQAVEELLGEA